MEEAAPPACVWGWVWVCGCVVGDWPDSVESIAAIWVCFGCEEAGEGKSFHCPLLYLGLLGFTVVSNCCSNGEEVAPLETYIGVEILKGEDPVTTTTVDC